MLEMDTNQIQVMSDDILTEAGRYMDQVREIQAEVAVLGTHWTGEAFNNFKTTFDASFARCEELYKSLEDISRSVGDVADAGMQTEQKMMDAMNS